MGKKRRTIKDKRGDTKGKRKMAYSERRKGKKDMSEEKKTLGGGNRANKIHRGVDGRTWEKKIQKESEREKVEAQIDKQMK